MPGAAATGAAGVRVIEESDGSPSAPCYKLVFPAGSLSISAGVATYSDAQSAAIYAGSMPVTNGAPSIAHPNGLQAVSTADDTPHTLVIARAGKLRRLRSEVMNLLGGAETIVVTAYINGVASSLTITHPNNAAASSQVADITNEPTVAIGDRVQVRLTSTDGTSNTCSWTLEFVPT